MPRLKPEVAAIVRACLINADPMDFATLLMANYVEEAAPAEIPVNPEADTGSTEVSEQPEPTNETFPLTGDASDNEDNADQQ